MTERSVTQSELRARAQGKAQTMSRTPIPMQDGRPQYVEAASGRILSEKPEELTHLHGNLLVPKTHPRIRFRGRLDSLMAEILSLQTLTAQQKREALTAHLQEVLEYTRTLLGAEVKEESLPEIHLEGMDAAAIRYASHHIRESTGVDHPIPNYQMGTLAIALNRLRTGIRETELEAAAAFTAPDGSCMRKDIVEGLNRLSSYIYILFCREVARGSLPAQDTSAVPAASCMAPPTTDPIPVEVSARHVHLSQEAISALFGGNYTLTRVRDLSQPGQFLSAEKVKVIGPKGSFPHVSILGPLRKELQVEVSLSDARQLGIDAPINLSGDLTGAADVTLVGPLGQIEAKGCTIVAKEHVHMPTPLAATYGVQDGEHVRVRVHTPRGATLDDVIVRVSDSAGLAVHIDTDQANAAGVSGAVNGTLLPKDFCVGTRNEENDDKR